MNVRSAVFSSLFATAFLLPSLSPASELFPPPSFGISRYQAIWERSPFIRETPPVPPPGLELQYSLVGVASLGGRLVAFLLDRSEANPARSRFMISTGRTQSTHGLELLEVRLDPEPSQSSATIRQGGRLATLRLGPTMRDPLTDASTPTSGAVVLPSSARVIRRVVRPSSGDRP